MTGTCSSDKCRNPVKTRGMCTLHYQRFTLKRREAQGDLCSMPECSKPVSARGWCHAHYTRWRKYGAPTSGSTKPGDPQKFFDEAMLFDGDDCLIWPFSKNKGYAHISIDGITKSVSRLFCETIYGVAPTDEHEAAHSCGRGDQGCVTKRHLRWATAKENAADKIAHGTTNRGERSPTAKITEKQALEIRRLCRKGVSQADMARRFKVYRSTISRIVSGDRWSWLGEGKRNDSR